MNVGRIFWRENGVLVLAGCVHKTYMVLVAHDLHGLAESYKQVTAFTNDSWLVLHSYLIMSATR